MKFAKEIEDDLVPEWRAKYFNYKQGKKRIKAIQRAIQNAQQKSPRTPLRRVLSTPKTPAKSSRLARPLQADSSPAFKRADPEPRRFGAGDSAVDRQPPAFDSSTGDDESSPSKAIPIPKPAHEQNPLNEDQPRSRRTSAGSGIVWTRYGSIIGSPPSPPELSRPATLNLPDPAIDPVSEEEEDSFGPRTDSHLSNRPIFGSAPTNSESPFEAGKTRHPSRVTNYLARRHMSLSSPDRAPTFPRSAERPLLRSIFSSKQRPSRKSPKHVDFPLEHVQEIEAKTDEFFSFLDREMDKIETFYKEKEEAATHRLKLLKEQLHTMRDQREMELKTLQDARAERRAHKHKKDDGDDDASTSDGNGLKTIPAQLRSIPHTMDAIYHPIKTAKQVHFGKDPKPNFFTTPPDRAMNDSKDYTRKPESHEIPYLQAKRKLKAALQEYYRGLELLKSYALLNRTAFRKINKKYDKGVRARPTMRYMTEKVNNAWFVRSTVIDEYIVACEDLYARYFENGSHKVAVGKLRKKNRNAGAYSGSVFRNGITAAAGMIFGIEGLVYAADLFYSNEGPNPHFATRTNFLLQIYAGYFLLLLLVLFFCFNCRIFTRAKVNYVFIFEFDTRHNLDWRQLSELPCFFLFLMGFIMWLNFSQYGGDTMYIWWPVVLIGLTILIMFLPAPILYHESRKWFLASCWRLLGAGLYPVEFRDFFLGDMFCSQTYSLGGIELFFCIYANSWTHPQQCNSSSSRLLGFFTAVPGIMRLFQCLRRYRDTGNIFPHLVNSGKYTFTILQYASLSAFRISQSTEMRAFFITCATINGVYCSIWDLVMDWSLMDPYAEHPFLRPHLAYKSPYPYYAAMIIDPILRFNWIFYVIPIFSDEIQHSALLGFLVSLSEVCRRGIWTIFRVENEHCTNVGRFRASRDVPLPYKIATESSDHLLQSPLNGTKTPSRKSKRGGDEDEAHDGRDPATQPDDDYGLEPTTTRRSDPEAGIDMNPATATGADLERATTRDTAVSSLRRRQQQGNLAAQTTPTQSIRARVGTILRGAHAQDFERRRKDGEEEHDAADTDDEDSDVANQSDDDDDDEEQPGGRGQATRDEAERQERRQERVADQEASRQNQADMQDAEMWLRRARSPDE